MSLSVEQMRDKIINVYHGPKWKYKVQSMHDRQIIEIYHKFIQEGKFDSETKKSSNYQAKQLVMEDFLDC